MKTRKRPSLLLMAISVLCFCSCQNWNEWDDLAGEQKNPEPVDTSAKLIAHFPFDTDLNATTQEGEPPSTGEVFIYTNGKQPQIAEDAERGNVFHQNGGYTRFANPLKDLEVQTGVSITMWVKMPQIDTDGALFSFSDDKGEGLYFTANAYLYYSGTGGWLEVNNPASGLTNTFTADVWNYIALSFTDEGYTIYINGEKKFDTNNHMSSNSGKTRAVEVGAFDYTNLITQLITAPYFYLGHGSATETKEVYFDDVKIYTNTIEEVDAKGPGFSTQAPTPVYMNTFDSSNDAQIIGGGSFVSVSDNGFGKVFQNATGGMRQNYLLLPQHALSHSTQSMEMSIGVWVNGSTAGVSADYMWAPLFTAYGAAPVNNENGFPVLALQYRGIPLINNAGYCDFTDAQNVAGVNTLYQGDTDWLANRGWHYYTATFTETSCKVYFDGKIANEWKISGQGDGNVVKGLFTNGADLKYICLGGNQAFTWGDNDPGFMFDDIAVFDKALSKNEIQALMKEKIVEAPMPVYENNFESGVLDAQIIGGGSIASVSDSGFGKVFKNSVGGTRKNYLLLPQNALSHSTESMETSIGVWVNATNAGVSADYKWAPLFMAYAAAPVNEENTFPILALQYRGLAQINCGGWCDFTDAQNVAGINTLYHDAIDWLVDHKWHYYTATFTATTAKIYIDGKIANEWKVDGTSDGSLIKGIFTNGNDLKYICLGGNQAWNWGDADPGFMFDDIAIYKTALTPEQIAAIISKKK